ncbi:MAG: M16 family metallopeptidase, partial [Phycisphaerae bacterium]
MPTITHDTLPCGIEYAVMPLPGRRVVSFQLRILSGVSDEPPARLGLARLMSETIDKGTEVRSGRALADAFDAIGASHGLGVGCETTSASCTVLPEHFEQALSLHAEFLRRSTFDKSAFETAVVLARQELLALDDDAQALADKIISRRAFGPVLGRHSLGEAETLERIRREDLVAHWQSTFTAGRMLAVVGGDIEPKRAADALQAQFEGFGPPQRGGRDPFAVSYTPGLAHTEKELAQQQISICWPGVEALHDDFPPQQVMLGILSGGMSGRLFTEVREKLGLVYWVSAWQETPRGSGMIFLGASTTPARCDETFEVLLKEVDRLEHDIQADELERAVTGITAQRATRGDTTRARVAELAGDLFFFGRPVPESEKIRRVKAVTIEKIRDYLQRCPRDSYCAVTLGPKAPTR